MKVLAVLLYIYAAGTVARLIGLAAQDVPYGYERPEGFGIAVLVHAVIGLAAFAGGLALWTRATRDDTRR